VISSPASTDPTQGFLRLDAVSRDGSRLFLTSGQQLVPADRDHEADVYMWSEGRYELVTPKGDLRGAEEEELELNAISNDGRRAYFKTWASLSPQDIDEEPDVYEWSKDGVRLVSPGSDGRQSAAFFAGISPNGRFVAFSTWEELIPGDNDVKEDVYLIDMGAGPLAGASASRSRHQNARRKRRRLRLITAESIPPRMTVAPVGRFHRDVVRLRLSCPKSERSGVCLGRAKLLRRGSRKVLARGRFRIRAGRRARVVLRVKAPPLRRVRRAFVRVRGVDLLGNAATVTRAIKLRRAAR
jgi:hypothetical protein